MEDIGIFIFDFSKHLTYNERKRQNERRRLRAMSEYRISEILPTDRRGMDQVNSLLEKEGIRKDKNLDYTVGLYDENYRLAATGSCFGNTLRCMAVDSDFQGEGLLGQLISHLTEYQYGRGNFHLFLYTKCSKAMFF